VDPRSVQEREKRPKITFVGYTLIKVHVLEGAFKATDEVGMWSYKVHGPFCSPYY